MDEAQLQLVITAQSDRVLTGLASFERALGQIEKAHMSAGQQADKHTALLNNFGSSLERIGRLANVFVVFEAVKGALSAFDGLEKHNIDLLRTTEILGGNATAASTWSVIAGEMGINIDNVDRAFAKLSTAMNSGSNPALKQMGIAASDANGKLRPLNDVVNQAADYFQRHAGAANNAALANALFGRSGYELLAILEQGRAGINAITEEARKYGLILDATTIERNAAFSFSLKETQLSLEGLGLALGNAALPGIAALGQGLSKLIEDNLPAFIAGVNRAASYVIGFIEALTGMDFVVGQGATKLSSLTNITGDTGSAMDSAAGASQRLQDAIQKVRDRTKDATDAIQQQINALNAQQQAQSFMDRQAKLQEDLANKGKDIDRLRQQEYEQFWLGNFQAAADIGDQITRAQQDQADLQTQITRGTEDEQTKLKVSALEAQKKSITDASNEQIAAMQKAARGTTAALTEAARGIPSMFGKAGNLAGLSFAKDFNAEAIGAQMGQQLMDAIFGKETQITFEGHGTKEITKTVRSGGGNWQKVGQAIGESIATGMGTAIGAGASALFKGMVHDWGKGLDQLANQLATSPAGGLLQGQISALRIDAMILRSFHHGGEVTGGSRGSEVAARLQVGERVLTENQNDEIVAVLRQILGAMRSSGAGRDPGVQAKLFNAIDEAKRWRSLGVVG